MIGVRKRPPAADGDEAGVSVFWEDHIWRSFCRHLFKVALVRRGISSRRIAQAPRMASILPQPNQQIPQECPAQIGKDVHPGVQPAGIELIANHVLGDKLV